jgi:glycosyltransferase involved in cell wall biosynthesis
VAIGILKVTHLIPSAPFGGAQNLAIDLAAAQRAAGIDAAMLSLGPGDQFTQAALRAEVPNRTAGRGWRRILGARRGTEQADLLHLHLPPPWLILALPHGPAKVLHLHVRPPRQVHARTVRRRAEDVAERALLAQCDHLIAISDWVKDAWDAQYPRLRAPVSVVYNGVQVPSVRVREPGPFTIGVACRLSDRKGIEEFVEMAALVYREEPKVRFRIAGDGPLRERYERLCNEAGLADAVTLEGFVGDMSAFWTRTDLAAFTPPFEPFGLRLIEPVAHGVPVIAYRNGSGSDEVLDRCRGIASVPYGDPDGLAQLALNLMRDPARLDNMARTGRQDVQERFSLPAMTKGVLETYLTTLAKRSR